MIMLERLLPAIGYYYVCTYMYIMFHVPFAAGLQYCNTFYTTYHHLLSPITNPTSNAYIYPIQLGVLKARTQVESTAEIGNLQRLILSQNRRVEGSSWYLNESSTQVLGY